MTRTSHLLLLTLPFAVALDAQSPFRQTRHAGLPPISGGFCYARGDVDGDGDLDLVVANDDLPSQLLLNDGRGNFVDATAGRLVSPANNDAHGIALADLDGDGDLDVLLDGGGLLENQAGVLRPFPNQLPNPSSAPHWFADVDGDGDLDVFTNAGSRLLRNQGNATFVNVTATAFAVPPTGGLAAIDVDLDGDIDLVTGTRLHLNNGNGTFTAVLATTAYPGDAIRAATAADFDGDGDADLPGMPNFLRHVAAATPPQIGGGYTVEVHARPGSTALAALCVALGAGATPTPFGPLALDPATLVTLVIAPIATPLTRNWILPNVPALVGTNLHYQGIVDDAFTGPAVTNSIRDIVQ